MTAVAEEQAIASSPVVGRLARTFVWTVGGQLLSVANQLVTVPLFLAAWGDALYGDWLAATALAAYFSLADMGMQTYTVNRLTQEAARGEWARFDRSLHSAFAMYAGMVAAGLAVIAALVTLLPWESWFAGRSLDANGAAAVVAMSAVGVLAAVLTGFLAGLPRAFAEADRSARMNVLVRFSGLLATMVALAIGAAPLTVAGVGLSVQLVALAAVAFAVSRRHPRTRPSLRLADRGIAFSLLAPSALFLLIQLAGGLTVHGTVLLTSAMLGGAAVTVYATSRTLANVVRQLVQLFGNTLWPELTRLASRGESKQLALAHRLLVKVSSSLAIAAVAALAWVGPDVYALWTQGRATLDVHLFRWLLGALALQTPWLASSVVLVATNNHRGLAFLHVAQGAAALGLAWLLVPVQGLAGIGIALAITDFALFGVVVPIWTQRLTGERFGAYCVGIYLPFAIAGLLAMGVAGWGWSILPESPWLRVGGISVVSGVVSLAGLALWLRADERRVISSLLGRLGARLRR